MRGKWLLLFLMLFLAFGKLEYVQWFVAGIQPDEVLVGLVVGVSLLIVSKRNYV